MKYVMLVRGMMMSGMVYIASVAAASLAVMASFLQKNGSLCKSNVLMTLYVDCTNQVCTMALEVQFAHTQAAHQC